MPTDLAALADEFEDNAGRLLYYAGNNSDRLFSAEECQQIAAALRQYADPRTALALRLLEIVENNLCPQSFHDMCDGDLHPYDAILEVAKGETP